LIGCALLASDSLYLLTTCFDWGPVAFQHLLIIGGTLALVRFFQDGSTRSLAGAMFLFGLAMWDKALAVWTLSALAIGGILTFPREIFRAITGKRVLIGVAAFSLGASPLLLYNAQSRGGTFTGNFQPNTAGIRGKAAFLVLTLSGQGLFAWMPADDWQTPKPHTPSGPIELLTDRISTTAGHPRESIFPYAVALALALSPFCGRKNLRLVLLAVIVTAVAWIQMAINENTGGGIHHTILLWPLPQFIVAVSFAGVSYQLGRAGKPVFAAVTAVVAISGALVINEYFVKAVRNGGAAFWTDGIYALSHYLKDTLGLKDSPSPMVFALDWGIGEQIRLLHRGRIRVYGGMDQVSKPEMTPADRARVADMIAPPGNIFIAHTPEFEVFTGSSRRLIEFAAATGYRRELLSTIADSYGRQVYEVYRFVPGAATSASAQPTSR
jgi:hypothetical protein